MDRPPRVFVTAGMTGSGSTWLYNAVRFVFLNAGHTVYSEWGPSYDASVDAQVHVVKVHEYEDKWRPLAEKLVMSERSVLDVAASIVDKGHVADDPQPLAEHMKALVEHERKWRKEADAIISYRDILLNPRAAIRRTMECLGIISVPVVCNVERDMQNLGRVVVAKGDPVTHYWPYHIRDGAIGSYAHRLSAASIRALCAMGFGEE